jgi:hypothetical protein
MRPFAHAEGFLQLPSQVARTAADNFARGAGAYVSHRNLSLSTSLEAGVESR